MEAAMKRKITLIGLFCWLMICVTAPLCKAESSSIQILTTTTDLADITRAIAGQAADVSSIASGK